MRKIALTAALLLVLPTTAKSEVDSQLIHNACASMSSYAETVMNGYQNGVPMRLAMEQAEIHKNVPYIREIVIDAYKQEQFGSKKYKNNEVIRFGNVWYQRCLSELGSTQK